METFLSLVKMIGFFAAYSLFDQHQFEIFKSLHEPAQSPVAYFTKNRRQQVVFDRDRPNHGQMLCHELF